MRSMTDCSGRVGVGNVAGMGPMHGGRLPKTFSVGSLRSNESDDFRELVRAASSSSSSNGVRSVDVDSLMRERMKRAGSDPGGMPRSCSVGMGKIDEDAPFVNGEENDFGNNGVKGEVNFRRNRSYDVTKSSGK